MNLTFIFIIIRMICSALSVGRNLNPNEVLKWKITFTSKYCHSVCQMPLLVFSALISASLYPNTSWHHKDSNVSNLVSSTSSPSLHHLFSSRTHSLLPADLWIYLCACLHPRLNSLLRKWLGSLLFSIRFQFPHQKSGHSNSVFLAQSL